MSMGLRAGWAQRNGGGSNTERRVLGWSRGGAFTGVRKEERPTRVGTAGAGAVGWIRVTVFVNNSVPILANMGKVFILRGTFYVS